MNTAAAITWGARARQRREHLHLTQVQVSTVTGLTQQAISRFERDEVIPRLGTLEKYARVYGTSVEELFPMQFRPLGLSKAAEQAKREKGRRRQTRSAA